MMGTDRELGAGYWVLGAQFWVLLGVLGSGSWRMEKTR
jgi:hypothetical protein